MNRKYIKNLTLIFFILSIIGSMSVLVYYSSSIYRIFCKVTGYGGSIRRAPLHEVLPSGSVNIKVAFNADISPNLPWKFYPERSNVSVRTGEQNLVFYEAESLAELSTTGMAVYNVTPHKAGKYFYKVACFCFSRQVLGAKQKVIMPVSFVIDPAIENDPDTQDVHEITLSYTFFPYKGE